MLTFGSYKVTAAVTKRGKAYINLTRHVPGWYRSFLIYESEWKQIVRKMPTILEKLKLAEKDFAKGKDQHLRQEPSGPVEIMVEDTTNKMEYLDLNGIPPETEECEEVDGEYYREQDLTKSLNGSEVLQSWRLRSNAEVVLLKSEKGLLYIGLRKETLKGRVYHHNLYAYQWKALAEHQAQITRMIEECDEGGPEQAGPKRARFE